MNDNWQAIRILARKRWGLHPMDWPSPPPCRPRWWWFWTPRWARRRLADLETVFGRLTDQRLDAFWAERRKGQDISEDAGGYLLRCYAAMCGVESDPVYTYRDYLADQLEGRGASDDDIGPELQARLELWFL